MSLKHTMFVLALETKNNFFLYNLFELLPIVPVSGFTFKKNDPIPYFGMEDIIVSIIPNNEIKKMGRNLRGVRFVKNQAEQSSVFGNAIAVDFQTNNKNYHMKISSSKAGCSKIHVPGITSFDIIKDITTKLITYIQNTNDLWKPFFILGVNERLNLVNFIINEIVTDNGILLPNGSDKINKNIEKYKDVLKPYLNVINLMLVFLIEYPNFEEYKTKLHLISQIKPGQFSIFHEQIEIKTGETQIYNGTYNGNLNCKNIVLPYLCTILVNKGYNSVFHNIGKKPLTIIIPILDKDGYIIIQNNNKIKAHKIDIKDKGSFKINSKASLDETMSIGYSIINLIHGILKSDEYLNMISSGVVQIPNEPIKNINESIDQHVNVINNELSDIEKIQNHLATNCISEDYYNDF